MTKMICVNCKREIHNLNKNTACYSEVQNVYFCKLDCLTTWAHEFLGCVSIDQHYNITTQNDK